MEWMTTLLWDDQDRLFSVRSGLDTFLYIFWDGTALSMGDSGGRIELHLSH